MSGNFEKIEDYYIFDITKIDTIDLDLISIDIEKMLYTKKIGNTNYSESGLYPLKYNNDGILCLKLEGFKAKRFIGDNQQTISIAMNNQFVELSTNFMDFLIKLTKEKLFLPLKKNLFNKGKTRNDTHFLQIKLYKDEKGLKNIKDKNNEKISNLPYDRFVGDFIVSLTGIFCDKSQNEKESRCSLVCHLIDCLVLKEINNDLLIKIKQNKNKNLKVEKNENLIPFNQSVKIYQQDEKVKNLEKQNEELKNNIDNLTKMFMSFMSQQQKNNNGNEENNQDDI